MTKKKSYCWTPLSRPWKRWLYTCMTFTRYTHNRLVSFQDTLHKLLGSRYYCDCSVVIFAALVWFATRSIVRLFFLPLHTLLVTFCRDAEWELNGQFRGMYEDVRCCRAEVCLCPYGRNHDVQIGWVHEEVSAPRLPAFARLGVVECVCVAHSQ